MLAMKNGKITNDKRVVCLDSSDTKILINGEEIN